MEAAITKCHVDITLCPVYLTFRTLGLPPQRALGAPDMDRGPYSVYIRDRIGVTFRARSATEALR